MALTLFEKYRPILTAGAPPVVRDPNLLIEQDSNLSVFYAPFDHVNSEARLVLVGITPGPSQMEDANNEARRALLYGKDIEEASRSAKGMGAFSREPLRSNLIKQLNHWGFDQWLGLRDSSDLFGSGQSAVQNTSLLRYPVFVDKEPYRGSPSMTTHAMLRKFLMSFFVEEAQQIKSALFVSLGPVVRSAMEWLAREGALEGIEVAHGLLHPSGQNTYRIAYLTGNRNAPIPYRTDPLPYDDGRKAFQEAYLTARLSD